MHHELPDLISEINRQKKEKWIMPFPTILQSDRGEDEKPRPQCLIRIKRTAKKSQDPFVELGEYEINLKVLLKPGTPDYTIFRYAYLFNHLLKTSESLTTLYDRYLMEECTSYAGQNGISGAEGHFIIRIYRENLK